MFGEDPENIALRLKAIIEDVSGVCIEDWAKCVDMELQKLRDRVDALEGNADASVRYSPTVRQAIETLKSAVQTDDDYAWTWHCNVAVSFQDEGGDHQSSNLAAARFMSTVFGVDVKKSPQWRSCMTPRDPDFSEVF